MVEEASTNGPLATTSYDPTTNYESRAVQGWPIRLNRRLVAQTNLCERVLKELDHQLDMTSRRLPLRRLPG